MCVNVRESFGLLSRCLIVLVIVFGLFMGMSSLLLFELIRW